MIAQMAASTVCRTASRRRVEAQIHPIRAEVPMNPRSTARRAAALLGVVLTAGAFVAAAAPAASAASAQNPAFDACAAAANAVIANAPTENQQLYYAELCAGYSALVSCFVLLDPNDPNVTTPQTAQQQYCTIASGQ
jgi:hypothetical protein